MCIRDRYYAIAHFSKFVRRGAKRIESQSKVEGLDHVAFENPDGGRVLVVTNSGAARTVSVSLGDRVADLELGKDSMATLCWS